MYIRRLAYLIAVLEIINKKNLIHKLILESFLKN